MILDLCLKIRTIEIRPNIRLIFKLLNCQKVKRGKKKKAINAANDESLNPFATINQMLITNKPLIQLNASVEPIAVATPFPPLNW